MSFAPGELSTIEGNNGATKVFNFADIPCPPASVASADSYFYNPAVNPGQAYQPRLAPPSAIYNLDPAWRDCVTAINQGFDPPIVLGPASGVTGPDINHARPIPRDSSLDETTPAAMPAHKVQYVPHQTSAPAMKR